MSPFFAKLFFSAAALLQPGVDLPWPAYQQGQVGSWMATTIHTDTDGQRVQGICVAQPGAYQVQVRLGMVPLQRGELEVAGWVMFAFGAESAVLALWRAAPEEWTLAEGSATFVATGPTCGRLTYAATGPAVVNHDPRVTSITIVRVGQ